MKAVFRGKGTIAAVLVVLAVLLAAAYLHFQNTSLQVSHYKISSGRVPKGFDGYKIVQISDFHNTGSAKLTEKLISEIKAENPDIIVITGDLIDSRNTDVKTVLQFIQEFSDVAPIYYVNGNHESRVIDEYAELKEGLENLGVKVLENEAVNLEKNGDEVVLMGISDLNFSETAQYIGEAQAADDQLSMLSEKTKYQFTILLSHRSELIEIYAANNMDLVFSGHAHGGQIRLPFIGPVIAPNQGLFPKYTSGVYSEEGTQMVVSRGIGNSLFPFRVNNRPELVVAELSAE